MDSERSPGAQAVAGGVGAVVWRGGCLFLEGRDSGPHLCRCPAPR